MLPPVKFSQPIPKPKILVRFERYHRASVGDLYQKFDILVEVKMSEIGSVPTNLIYFQPIWINS